MLSDIKEKIDMCPAHVANTEVVVTGEGTLSPASQLAASNTVHFSNESAEYRTARSALLEEEIELRRLERVAAQRRALPQGGEIPRDFEFLCDTTPIQFSSLFGDKDTLMIYSMMYDPARKTPRPMCTSFLPACNGVAINLRERCAICSHGPLAHRAPD